MPVYLIMKLQKPKGTQDILPSESANWQYVEAVARETFKKYHYSEIRTPMFEHYEVISRSVGDTTDIVTKEMYDFYGVEMSDEDFENLVDSIEKYCKDKLNLC